MTLFSAASRMRAALYTTSVRLFRDSSEFGSLLVANRYKWPTEDGLLVVRSVHVCYLRLNGARRAISQEGYVPRGRAIRFQRFVVLPRSGYG